jgi:transposase-like protein
MARDLKPVYTAPPESAAKERFAEFTQKWGQQYPAIIKMWDNAWSEFVPFLDYDVEIRRVICSTNAIESVNARYRRAVRARGHFPTEQAALKCLYLATLALDPTGKGKPAMGNEVEARAQCVRNHLRRTHHPKRYLTDTKVGSTVNRTPPLKPHAADG